MSVDPLLQIKLVGTSRRGAVTVLAGSSVGARTSLYVEATEAFESCVGHGSVPACSCLLRRSGRSSSGGFLQSPLPLLVVAVRIGVSRSVDTAHGQWGLWFGVQPLNVCSR